MSQSALPLDNSFFSTIFITGYSGFFVDLFLSSKCQYSLSLVFRREDYVMQSQSMPVWLELFVVNPEVHSRSYKQPFTLSRNDHFHSIFHTL